MSQTHRPDVQARRAEPIKAGHHRLSDEEREQLEVSLRAGGLEVEAPRTSTVADLRTEALSRWGHHAHEADGSDRVSGTLLLRRHLGP